MAEFYCAEFALPSGFPAREKTSSGKSCGAMRGDAYGALSSPSELPYDWVYVPDDTWPEKPLAGTESRGEGRIVDVGNQMQMGRYFFQEEEKVSSFPVAGDDPRATQVALWAAANGSSFNRKASDADTLPLPPLSTPLRKHKCDVGIQSYAAVNKQQKQVVEGLLCPPAGKPFSAFAAGVTKNTTTGCYGRPSLMQHKDAVAQIHQLKRQQFAELQLAAAWRRHNRAKAGSGLAGGGLPGSTRSWTPSLQQAGSGMTAVFLGAASRRETCGTGVFLPRRRDAPTEPRKKPALSSVLLPARVMQALNLNLDELGAAQSHSSGGFELEQDGGTMMSRSPAATSQRGNSYPQPLHTAGHRHHDVCLPSEWTY